MAIYDHLPLRRLEGALERRQRPGFGRPVPRDPAAHGAGLTAKLQDVVTKQQQKSPINGIDPALILKIETKAPVGEEVWQALDLILLSDNEDQSVVLFANDKELTEFKRRVAEYQKGTPEGQKNPAYAALVTAIENVAELGPQDRIGAVLRSEGKLAPADFVDAHIEVLDVELWQAAPDDVFGFLARAQYVLETNGGQLINEYRGSTMTLLRVRAAGPAIRALLNLPEVLVIDRPPEPDMPQFDVSVFTAENLGPANPPAEGSVVIGVIDSGMASAHPLAAGAVRGAFGEPATLGDADERGHGTSVAGIAMYGDVRQRVEQNQFDARFAVASAKLVGVGGTFPDEALVAKTMEVAIRRLHDEFHCRVINISLNDWKRKAGDKPTPWAAMLDMLARELDLVIVVSTGNRRGLIGTYGDGVVDAYPACLLDEDARLFEPATAVNAVTVGSLAHSNGISEADGDLAGVMPIAEQGEPSPFTRTGPGVQGIIKPDFVDYGGTAVFDGPTQTLAEGSRRSEAGVISLNREFIPRMLRSVSGTSFASPLVAYKAALVRETFQAVSANLVRALLAIAADHPESAEERLEGMSDEELRRVLGNGLIDVEKALNSNDNRVVLIREDTLEVNRFAVFEIPIPEIFQGGGVRRRIRIALAFDPVVRHTRLDYAGLSMSFDLFRGVTAEEVFNACRKWEKAEGDPFRVVGARRCELAPSITLRGKGTLQCGTFTASRGALHPYGDTYYLAVRCEGGWASAITPEQRFAVAVELAHKGEIQLYQRVQQRIQLPA